MKYNPRVNELVARTEGLAWAHPYQPEALSQGAMEIMAVLEDMLAEITGMDAVTLQPAAGAHGEMTGILLMRALLETQGNPRKKLLIPDSAHGTNPATATMAGLRGREHQVATIAGLSILQRSSKVVNEDVAGLMITNPNTLGVFEENIIKIARSVHAKGALVYMDGANMNALVGIARPGDFGIDVMHLNLHKTFSTPHGGGGPGAGPVAVKKALEPFLPTPRLRRSEDDSGPGTTTARNRSAACARSTATSACWSARWPTSWRTAAMDCAARRVDAVLNANYIRKHSGALLRSAVQGAVDA